MFGDNLEHILLVIDDRKSNKPMPPGKVAGSNPAGHKRINGIYSR